MLADLAVAAAAEVTAAVAATTPARQGYPQGSKAELPLLAPDDPSLILFHVPPRVSLERTPG